MAEISDLRRLEDQIYYYCPELRGDSEDLKLERRNRLFMQLHSSQPEVHLVALDAVSSLTNIKNILEKCTQKSRRTTTRKRRTTSIQYNGSEENKMQCGRKDDSPLSLSILIPQVVKGSEKVEISIDLGEIDTSQRLFANRVDELLRKRTNSCHMPEYDSLKENLSSSKCKDFPLPIATSSTNEAINENNEKQDDEMLSRLISQVLVENQETSTSNQEETLRATNLLDNINNNECSNYDGGVPHDVESPQEQLAKKKRQRKPKKSRCVDKGPPKKRGRKPKNKYDEQGGLEPAEIAKSDLAKYVELFSNSCNMAGSITPAASSTVSQQLVTSTTHYLDSSHQQPITYYLDGDWENGGNCQLVQTDSTHVDGGQEEFNMAELVNYIDNVDDAGNAIARVLDGPAIVPVFTQNAQSQINLIEPHPAHVSNVLLDLSKKSTISYSLSTPDISNVSTETANRDLMPLDLSLKSSKLIQAPILNTNLSRLETNNSVAKLDVPTENVFEEQEYASFGAALDMPLIDLEDNINAFMQLTNNEVITSTPGANNTSTDCALPIKETANNTLPICDFQLGEILSESTLCNNNYNHDHHSQPNGKINDLHSNVVNNVNNNYNHSSQSNSKMYCLNSGFVNNVETERNGNSLEQRRHDNDIPKNSENLRNPTAEVNLNTISADVGEYERTSKSNSKAYFSQDSDKGECYDEHSDAKEDNTTNIEAKSANGAVSNEGKTDESPTARGFNHIDELHGDSGDLLFVDTESFMTNHLKSLNDGTVTASHLDAAAEYGTATANAIEQDIENNEDLDNDLSAKEDHSKSIDLIEDHESHNVSVHLPISQLALLETNSEEFAYEMGLESSEEKDTTVTDVPEKQQLVAIKHHNEENEANESEKSGYSICNDSGIGNSVVGDNAATVPILTMALNNSNNNCTTVNNFTAEEAEKRTTLSTGTDHQNTNIESGKNVAEPLDRLIEKAEDLNQMCECEENEILNKTADVSSKCLQNGCTEEQIEPALTHHTTPRQEIERESDNVKVRESNPISNLSVLEMELKMNVDCLDFEDEMEDDALSLATSCFNSSDDEEPPDTDCASAAATHLKSDSSNEKNEHMQAVNIRNEAIADDKSAVVKLEATQCSKGVPNEVLKKFKIPKISMTTATAKHGGPTAHVATAAALPMVILPTNAFNKPLIKTESDVIKPVYLEKLTRTVQNVCAVTPLTLQQPSYHQSQTAVINQNSFNTVKPLMRDVVKLPTPSNEEHMKDLKAVADNKQIVCRPNEFAGIGGHGRKSSGHTIGISNTFGVTCLPFLVNRCSELGNCDFSHTFREPAAVGNLLLTFSELDLNIAYRFAYNHELLFRRYMHEFCRVYSMRNNRVKLLNMARDCERYPNGGKLLVTIFHSLEYCGLNKINACRQILSYSRDRTQETIDVLLEIILEADWTMFCDYIEKFVDITAYKFRVNVLHQMAPTILNANDQRLTSLFFKCLVNLDSNDVGLVQTSPILMQLLELIKNGQICR